MSSKRSRIPGMAFGWTARALAAALALLARPADASVAVYVSDDPLGYPQGELEIDTQAPDELELWIYKGSAYSPTVCDEEEGSGDAICGYHVQIEVQGFGYIANFEPASVEDVVYYPTSFTIDTRQLQVSCVDVGPSSTPVPVHIGTLTVNAMGGSGSEPTTLLVQGKHAVAADLALENIASNTIAVTPVPEPAEILLLASGIAGLAWLYRLRRGSPSPG